VHCALPRAEPKDVLKRGREFNIKERETKKRALRCRGISGPISAHFRVVGKVAGFTGGFFSFLFFLVKPVERPVVEAGRAGKRVPFGKGSAKTSRESKCLLKARAKESDPRGDTTGEAGSGDACGKRLCFRARLAGGKPKMAEVWGNEKLFFFYPSRNSA